MSDEGSYVDPLTTFLTEEEVSKLLRVAIITLRKWRISGEGPEFHRFGRRITYLLKDVLDWAATKRLKSTSEKK